MDADFSHRYPSFSRRVGVYLLLFLLSCLLVLSPLSTVTVRTSTLDYRSMLQMSLIGGLSILLGVLHLGLQIWLLHRYWEVVGKKCITYFLLMILNPLISWIIATSILLSVYDFLMSIGY